ncbi:MAG: outer membrane beta-barrel protein [Candidatus Omnitrophica bacterium]|nr:outer membrane beta-barrel protein [Candidatus Omnitrophota bacterium]
MKKLLTTTILTVIFLFNLNAFADEGQEIKIEDTHDYLKPLRYVEVLTQPIKRHLRKNKIDLNFFAGLLQGYDNNVNLDPERKKDGFLETSLNTEAVYNYTDDIRLKVENDTANVLYYNEKDASLLDIYNKAGLELDLLNDALTVGMDYALDYLIFPRDEDGTYLSHEVKAFIKHAIVGDFYHKIGYRLLFKNYSHDKTLNGRKERTSKLRHDVRNGIDYEAGMHLLDRAIVKTSLQFYRNKSNYEYHDYYDYWSFKVRPSFILMLNDKLYTSGSFTYQQRTYDGRLSSEDDEHVYDDTYSFNISVLYDITRSFTFALSLSYRENSSNEPLQKYSGTVFTGGLYYSF